MKVHNSSECSSCMILHYIHNQVHHRRPAYNHFCITSHNVCLTSIGYCHAWWGKATLQRPQEKATHDIIYLLRFFLSVLARPVASSISKTPNCQTFCQRTKLIPFKAILFSMNWILSIRDPWTVRRNQNWNINCRAVLRARKMRWYRLRASSISKVWPFPQPITLLV